MKRLILTLAAVAAMVSCSKDDIVSQSSQQAIAFADAFVENSTRAVDGSYTNDTLTEFEVYGTITGSQQNGGGTANIFKQELVSKNLSGEGTGDEWKYNAAHTQYWIAGNTYNFKAIADGNVSGVTEVVTDQYDMPTAIKLLDASKQKDILYAEDLNVEYTSGEKTVDFTFEHLMAKAKFTVKNAITTDSGYSYMVKDVKITNAAKDAVYTIGTGWATTIGTYKLSFGDIVDERLINNNTPADYQPIDMAYNTSGVSNYERLIIPTVTTGINVEFTCELYKSRVLIDKQTKKIQADNLKITKGNAYNFVISLGNPGEPIKFTVQNVTGWDTDNNDDGTDNDTTTIANN